MQKFQRTQAARRSLREQIVDAYPDMDRNLPAPPPVPLLARMVWGLSLGHINIDKRQINFFVLPTLCKFLVITPITMPGVHQKLLAHPMATGATKIATALAGTYVAVALTAILSADRPNRI